MNRSPAQTPPPDPAVVRCATFSTPVGDFSVAVDSAGSIVAAAFGDKAALQKRIGRPELREDPESARQVRAEIDRYFEDATHAFKMALAPSGTPFQKRVWQALREIPCGQTRSYGQLAADLNSSPRAIGRANATNPICLVVPCHRVIGADGSLTGFAFGEKLKRRLLEHEGARLAEPRRRSAAFAHP